MFPELRHEGFKPNQKIAKKAAKALEDNEELANEIEAIRKEMEKEKSKK